MAMIACIKATVGETPQGLETDQVPFQSLGYEQDLERVLLGLSGEIGVEDLSEALAPIERFYLTHRLVYVFTIHAFTAEARQ